MKKIHIVLETGSLAGGVRVVGEIANRLKIKDWDVQVWSVNPRSTIDWFPLDRRIPWNSYIRTGTVDDYDQLTHVLQKQDGYKLATFWRTAYAVNEASKPGEGLYLVQDVETSYAFGPNMKQAVVETYKMPIRKLTTSRWVEKQLDCEYIGIGVSNFYKNYNKFRQGFVLACARRQALKGWDALCETYRYLIKRGKEVRSFGIDGYGAVPVKHPTMFASHKYYSRPTDTEVRELYNRANVFINSSIHEGLSLSPLESMLCGCPTVVTNSDGNMEYARDGENCIVRNDPLEIANSACELLRDKELSARLVAEGEKTAKEYSWTKVIDRLENLLSS